MIRPAPQLSEWHERSLNWIGRFVSWIRKNDAQGVIYQVLTRCLAFFLSLALIASVIGLPLFILGFKEFIIQEKDDRDRIQFEKHHRAAIETNNHSFQNGRLHPLKDIDIRLKPKTRKEIREDLKLKEKQPYTDRDLFQFAAMKYTDFLKRYRISLVSK